MIIGTAALSFSACTSAPALARATAAHHHSSSRSQRSHGSHRGSSKPHHNSAKRHSTPRSHHGAAHHSHGHAPATGASVVELSPQAQVASVLATPCENTEITPEAANITLVRESVMCLINHVRAEHSEPPLKNNADLERAAGEHSRELVELDYFAHVSPSGLTPVQRIREAGYIPGPEFGYVIGENLAWGTLNLSTPQSIVNAWVASPGHLANILESQYKETGIAIVPSVPPSLGNGQQGATYAQEFGVIIE